MSNLSAHRARKHHSTHRNRSSCVGALLATPSLSGRASPAPTPPKRQPTPSNIKHGRRFKRGAGEKSPAGVLGVSPIFIKFPQDWGIKGVERQLSPLHPKQKRGGARAPPLFHSAEFNYFRPKNSFAFWPSTLFLVSSLRGSSRNCPLVSFRPYVLEPNMTLSRPRLLLKNDTISGVRFFGL